MIKKIFAALFVAGLVVTALPAVTLATDIDDYGFTVNDQASDEVRAGSRVDFGFLVDVDSPDHVEMGRVRLYDTDGNIIQSPDCFSIDPPVVFGNDVLVERSVTLRDDLSDQPLEVRIDIFGIPGEERLTTCDSGEIIGGNSWKNRLFVNHEASTSDNNVGVGASPDDGVGAAPVGDPELLELRLQVSSLLDAVSQLTAAVQAMQAAPNASAYCAALPGYENAGTPDTYTAANTRLQKFLQRNHFTIPALDAGALYGFWGPQTQDALDDAYSTCPSQTPTAVV